MSDFDDEEGVDEPVLDDEEDDEEADEEVSEMGYYRKFS